MSAPATTSLTTESSTRWSLGIYLGLMIYLVGVKATLELGLVDVAVPSQETLFGWPVIGFIALAGGLSVWLGPRTGLPYLWGGAIVVEALYRLIPLTLLLWLVANVAARRRARWTMMSADSSTVSGRTRSIRRYTCS